MPIGDVLRFFAARAVPATLGFFALVVFTRLLTPAEFGIYSVMLSGANVVTAAVFYWLALSAVRFGVDNVTERDQYLSAILLLYIICIVLTLLGFGAFQAYRRVVDPALFTAGGIVFAESWFQLNQKLAIARVQPKRFAIMASTKVLIGLFVGSLAALGGFGATGVLGGLIVGSLCAGFAPSLYREWRRVGLRSVSRVHVVDVLKYGGPLGVTTALGYTLGTVDRLLLTIQHGAAAAGQYAAGYDLAYSTLTLVLTTVNMVVYPHVLNAADSNDVPDQRRRFKGSLDLLLVVALPVLIGLVAFAPNVTEVVLGAQFSESAARVLPWVAWATFVGGLRSYYLDIVFHLERDTRAILWIVVSIVSVNVVLNLSLIPTSGIQGALIAIVIAQFVGFAMSTAFGFRRRRRAPGPDRETIKIVAAACIAGIVGWLVSDQRGAQWLCIQVALVGTTYCISLASLRASVFVEFVRLMVRRFDGPLRRIRVR